MDKHQAENRFRWTPTATFIWPRRGVACIGPRIQNTPTTSVSVTWVRMSERFTSISKVVNTTALVCPVPGRGQAGTASTFAVATERTDMAMRQHTLAHR